jgi:hypothetical protein
MVRDHGGIGRHCLVILSWRFGLADRPPEAKLPVAEG